jgi:hypothetical protein
LALPGVSKSGLVTILYAISMNEAGLALLRATKYSEPNKIQKTMILEQLDNRNLTVGITPNFQCPQFGSRVVLVGDFGYLGFSNDNGENLDKSLQCSGTALPTNCMMW